MNRNLAYFIFVIALFLAIVFGSLTSICIVEKQSIRFDTSAASLICCFFVFRFLRFTTDKT